MAQIVAGSGSTDTLYFIVCNEAGEYWNGAAFEAYDAPSWTDYDIAMAQDGASGIFRGTFPAVAAGAVYDVFVFLQAGGTPAVGDDVLYSETFSWDGTTLRQVADIHAISFDATAANNLELAFDGTGFGFTNCTMPTVTTLTNKTGFALSAAGIDAIWDELTTGHVTVGSFGVGLTSILADTNELQTDWTNGGRLDLILDSILSNTGTGARTISVTVNDGADPIEGAHVRMVNGIEDYSGYTDVNGEIVFGLDDLTWAVAITKPGYTFTPTTLVVTADASVIYSMTVYSFTPSDPGTVTGYLYTYDETGVVEEGVEVEMVFYSRTSTAASYDQTTNSATSDVNGLVEFTGLFPGATYMIRRGVHRTFRSRGTYYAEDIATKTNWLMITIPDGASSPYQLAVVWGQDPTT